MLGECCGGMWVLLCVVWFGFRICMITPNTNSSFIQVKSENLWSIYHSQGTLFEVKREGEMHKRIGGMDDLLLSVVDETLEQIFKGAGARVIYKFMENKCHLRRKEIAEKPEVFSAGLERLLGSAAPMIERMILKNLCSKLRLKFEEKEGYDFSDYVKELRGRFDR